ncbi:hypothetical protein LUZ61_005611 [Rhynchospora tenuis]|uniref:Reverse transcriptase domain-containing protein n=1 Tax=Rhynchospora tenuis TaxID=198213 RepID=A0AAD6EUQ9_9POAL|nr:hypothetical protein LUZ61_005611 [Rhynchospora tenuis]
MIFQSEEVPDDWLKGHVTLIPKTVEPLTSAEYRPISVGNILYRLVMKLVATRLRPFLKKVVSQEQNAFLKGRSIADNIILVKEILHSFSQKNFKQHAFLLKADINKAFDKLDWSFLKLAMQHLNVPTKIINIMMSSYARARITIHINGRGDGFMSPTQGLRQGCPMSPYVFIISMEVLSRLLQKAMSGGVIRGVKVAHTSPQVTHVVYADDLVLMGDVNATEVQVFTNLLEKFGKASGLSINPHKSGLWFSKPCTMIEIQQVQGAWNAARIEAEERYLGVMISQKGDIKRSGVMLLEKIKSKLTGWKSNMLSHAGRMVLIKSVLMSMPVYAMALEMLPKGILKDINRLLAKFFWGKVGHDRYMSFVSWEKVCKPYEKGGLGVKDLEKFGEALFLKVVWALMADEDKPWVKICKSKYYPMVGFWRAKNTGGCSKMWGQVVKMRDFFTNHVEWRLENGKKVNALSQPWFQNWSVREQATPADRKLKVISLLDGSTGDWKMQELSQLFQPNQIHSIIGGTNKPNVNSEDDDRMVWLKTKNGRYVVKEGYKELTCGHSQFRSVQNVNWQIVWKWKGISPKVKIFLWRLLHKGLPLGVNMHARFTNYSPMCQRCQQENEYEMHCLFFCNTSRQVWFGSPLGIRVHELSLDIATTITQIMGAMDEEGNSLFANTLWELWKERNKNVIEHLPFKPQDVLQRVKTLGVYNQANVVAVQQRANERMVHEKYEFDAQGWQVVMDGSWDTSNLAGGAYVVYNKGCVHSTGLIAFQVQDPFHAEAMTMQEAVNYMNVNLNLPRATRIQFFSDCLNLVEAVNQRENTDLPSWRAKHVVTDLIKQLEERNEGMTVHHVQREAVSQAHGLANIARRRRLTYQGAPHMALNQEVRISTGLDEQFFQRVQEAPP